jgi:hypothetical protein
VSSKAVPFVLVVALATAGCSMMRREGAMQKERMLAAAGFQMKFANTPALASQATEMPQRRVVPVPADGGVRYVYADTKYCNCIYAGTEKAYDRYQRLLVQSDIAQENAAAASEEEEAQLDWGMWGPWGPWY